MTTARDQLFFDVFVTALEGGIGYWSACNRYHWMIGPPAHDVERASEEDVLGFHADIEDDDGEHYLIDRAVIAAGYKLATESEWSDRIAWSTDHPPYVITADTDWDFDAGDADLIVQLGLFNDVIYG